tara:strand:+ start:709 stop:1236 length:528 start_codon:yes stop_codon:yes gene_type:complete
MNIESGSIITYSAKYGFRHLVSKPMHYLIQIFTGSRKHHMGSICNGWYFEATKKNDVRKILFETKLKELSKYVSYEIHPPKRHLTKEQEESMFINLNNQVGKKYSALGAFLSILTAALFLSKKKLRTEEWFCSHYSVWSVLKVIDPSSLREKNILPREYNPEEALKLFRKIGYIA